MKELVPTVSAKVRDSVRDTVRDAVKAQLPAAFRDSFETALLPAFEAGAQAMFQQLQAAFVQGMQGVMQESVRAQRNATSTSDKLEGEVRELRETVARLEGNIAALTDLLHGAVSGATLGVGDAGATQQEDEIPEDAFSLLKKVLQTVYFYSN